MQVSDGWRRERRGLEARGRKGASMKASGRGLFGVSAAATVICDDKCFSGITRVPALHASRCCVNSFDLFEVGAIIIFIL